ncbi:MAG: ABC-F family ATP-binding cassette domain-containing protein [bacterium]|nr:ABC-F family ATP-binding cassette domain-containing protein [bacterium]
MLHINDLTYRIEGRLLIDKATTAIPAGHKVGLVGRNGVGKSTLLHLLTGKLHGEDGSIRMPRNARMGLLAQEAPDGEETLLETVLVADVERHSLLEEAETATAPNRISEIHLRLSDIDAHSAPARAAGILAGLGFNAEAQQRPCSSYSGGWRMRVALAAMLFSAPDLLLLDEPSNYLDLEGTIWLENFLRTYPHTLLIVSHDRDLLNNAVNAILLLADGKLTLYGGNYDTFEKTRREQQRLQLKLKKKQDDKRRHMESFVDRFKAKASKAKQAQSRLKALQKLKPIAAEVDGDVAPFLFPTPEKTLGNPLMRIEDISIGYAPTQPVLRNVNLRLDIDDRIGLLGANGNGKSTFAKFLCGKLKPLDGYFRHNKKMQVGFFAQHQMDELKDEETPYDHILELMENKTESQRRAKLGSLGFGIEKANTKAKNLSGGEKARLLFALASFYGPHLLILDEPTNHLDVDSCQMLIQALNEYEGAVILISHDRHLVEACVDRLWMVKDQTVEPYDGDLDSYRAELLVARSNKVKKEKSANAGRSKKEQRQLAAKRRAELAPMRKKIKGFEKQMETLSGKIEVLDVKLGEAGLYDNDPDKANELAVERGRFTAELVKAEETWISASEAYEKAKIV